MDTPSPEDRIDLVIREVARAMTEAPHGDIAGGVVARLAKRRRMSRRILVPAMAAAVIIVAVATAIELRAPTPAPPPPSMTVVTIPGADVRLPAASPAPAARTPEPRVGPRTIRPRLARLPLDPPFESDLAPEPLRVTSVAVPPMSVAAEPSPPPIDIEPIDVAPLEPKGGSR